MTSLAPTREHHPGRRPPRSDAERRARLDAVVERLVARGGIAHVIAGVSTLDGSFRWEAAAGTARPDGTPMRTDTPFFIASVTKLYIATLVLQLVEDGTLDLDAPITRELPADVTDGLHRLDGVDHTDRITVRHLLSHTSGLPDFLEDRPRGGRSWYRELRDGVDREWTFDDVVARTRELRPRFIPRDPSSPRARARYSDTGFQLLIAIVEAATGRSFAEQLEQRLLRPFDLRATFLPGRSRPLDPTPVPALVYHRDRALHVPNSLVSCRDLVSTLDDTQRFLRAWVTGAVFTDRRTAHLRTEVLRPWRPPLRYGLGMMRFPINALAAPGHRRASLIGHSGATGSWAFHCPEHDLLLTGTVDQITGRAVPFRTMVRLVRAAAG
jgi:D-alanyl-D-alanine carboxypeptidase